MKSVKSNTRGMNEFTLSRLKLKEFFDSAEHIAAQYFGENFSPFNLTGPLCIALFIICAITGLWILGYYRPDPQYAHGDLIYILNQIKGGALLRAVHRISSNLLVLALLIHLLRTWARGDFRGPRARSWIAGVLILPVIGIIGWAGYVLQWSDQSAMLLTWGRELAQSPDSWPIIGWLKLGTLIDFIFFSADGKSELFIKIFGLHVGGAGILVVLWLLHLRKLKPAKIVLPWTAWIALIMLTLLIAGMNLVDERIPNRINPFAPPGFIEIDLIMNFPLLFFQLLGAPLLSFFVLLFIVALVLLPKSEPLRVSGAEVIESKCTGCRICVQDCPYDAIILHPHHDAQKRRQGKEIARVISTDCAACGICVGSCDFGAIEMGDLSIKRIEERLDLIFAAESATDENSMGNGGEI